MADDDLVYLLRRAAEERKRAADARHASAKAAHQGMADAYESRARNENGGPRERAR